MKTSARENPTFDRLRGNPKVFKLARVRALSSKKVPVPPSEGGKADAHRNRILHSAKMNLAESGLSVKRHGRAYADAAIVKSP